MVTYDWKDNSSVFLKKKKGLKNTVEHYQTNNQNRAQDFFKKKLNGAG